MNSKIVCNCLQITLDEILEAINSGATSVVLLQEITAVGTGCGRCLSEVRGILSEVVG
ncbi:MAG: (2Fe-2S)-binding protein [Flavobacteriaceae bacterium]|nr:(2Fe-2S)-binding protein [Flavobacteriaceae bacterium]